MGRRTQAASRGHLRSIAPCGHLWPATGIHPSMDSYRCARCWTKISKGRITRSQPASGLGEAEGDLNFLTPRCELLAGLSATVVCASASYGRVHLGPLPGNTVAALRC